MFRRGAGKVVPDLRATGAAGRVFGKRLSRDIRNVRNVKRVGAVGTGLLLEPFIPPFIRELPARALGGSE